MSSVVEYENDHEHLSDRIRRLVEDRESFKIVNVIKQSVVVELVEDAIESNGMTCRVRTNGRGWAAAGVALATGGLGAIAAAGAIAAHDLATYDPDFEVIKDMFGSDITVEYCK